MRPIKIKAFVFVFRLHGLNRVRQYLGGTVGRRQRFSRFKHFLVAPSQAGIWVACLANVNRPIGLVELGPHKDGKEYEISYQFDPTFWGNGLASEAVRAIVEHALYNLGMERVIAETKSANSASFNLLRKQGMVLSDQFEPVSVYRGMRKPRRNKAVATQREPRFGSV